MALEKMMQGLVKTKISEETKKELMKKTPIKENCKYFKDFSLK